MSKTGNNVRSLFPVGKVNERLMDIESAALRGYGEQGYSCAETAEAEKEERGDFEDLWDVG